MDQAKKKKWDYYFIKTYAVGVETAATKFSDTTITDVTRDTLYYYSVITSYYFILRF